TSHAARHGPLDVRAPAMEGSLASCLAPRVAREGLGSPWPGHPEQLQQQRGHLLAAQWTTIGQPPELWVLACAGGAEPSHQQEGAPHLRLILSMTAFRGVTVVGHHSHEPFLLLLVCTARNR